MSDGLTRRELFRASLAAGGALLLEIALPGCHPKGPVQLTARPGDFVPNAWLRITPEDRVVFTLDRVEMGQGTMTSQAQLVAEELEYDPSKFVIELAQADRAYDNADPQLNVQITGGSTSTKVSYDPLRKAGAAAREMLIAAAARRWGVDPAGCKADDGVVIHAATNRRARYGELATAAAHEPVPGDVKLKSPQDFRWIGKSVPRLDSRMKVDGTGIYGIDFTTPGMHVAVVIRPPTLGARLVRFDAKEALAEAGVEVIVIPQGVAVVAPKYWQARRAAGKVRVEWTRGEVHISSDFLRKQYMERLQRPAPSARSEGNASSAEQGAAQVIEAYYEVPYLAHAPMEPQNATARVTAEKCEVWAPTQSPGVARASIKRILGYSDDRILVHQTLVGGGFGRRLAQDYIEEAVEIARRAPGRPVKVMFSREDDMQHSNYRPMVMTRLRGGVGRDGSIVSWRQRIVAQSILRDVVAESAEAVVPQSMPAPMKLLTGRSLAAIAGGSGITDPTAVEGARSMAYSFENLEIEYAPIVHAVPVGPWRSVGNSHNCFTVEAFFDELCHAGHKDPFLARRELLRKAPRDRAVLELAAEKIGWSTPPPAGRSRGIAQGKAFNSYLAHAVEVSVHGPEVRVHRVVSAVDCGKIVNPDIVRMQIESAIAFGLGAALRQEITWKDGAVEQGNFNGFEPLRMFEMPTVEVHIVPSSEPSTGIGEPGVPPIAPAVANAILAATGRPVRVLPFTRGLAPEVKR